MTKIYAAYLALTEAAKSVDDDAVHEVEALAVKQFASGNDSLNALVEDAQWELLAIAERASAGELTQNEFKLEYLAALLLLLRNAAKEGGGVDDYDMLPLSGKIEVDKVYQNQLANIDNLTADIFDGRYLAREEAQPKRPAQTESEGLSKLANRILLWAVPIASAVSLGALYTSEKLMWVYGPTEHCVDCIRLNGQVHTREEWIDSGWRPQGGMLACTGRHCQCELVSVDPNTPTEGSF